MNDAESPEQAAKRIAAEFGGGLTPARRKALADAIEEAMSEWGRETAAEAACYEY